MSVTNERVKEMLRNLDEVSGSIYTGNDLEIGGKTILKEISITFPSGTPSLPEAVVAAGVANTEEEAAAILDALVLGGAIHHLETGDTRGLIQHSIKLGYFLAHLPKKDGN